MRKHEDEGDRHFMQEGAIIGGAYLDPVFSLDRKYLTLYFPDPDQQALIAYYLIVGYYGVTGPLKKSTTSKMGSSLYKRFTDHSGIRKTYRWFYKMMNRINFILKEMKKAEANMDFKRIVEIKTGFLDVQGRTVKRGRTMRKHKNIKSNPNSDEAEWLGLD